MVRVTRKQINTYSYTHVLCILKIVRERSNLSEINPGAGVENNLPTCLVGKTRDFRDKPLDRLLYYTAERRVICVYATRASWRVDAEPREGS